MRKLRLYWLAVAVPFVLAIVVGISSLPLRTNLQNLVFDSYQRLHPLAYDPQSPVRIVDIDDELLSRLGQWPWPRSQIAAIVDKLKQSGALSIGFDVVFSEADQMSIAQLIRDQPHERAMALISQLLEKEGSYDEVLARSLNTAHAALGVGLTNGTPNPKVQSEDPHAATELPIKVGFARAGDDPLLFLHRFPLAIAPIKILSDHADGIGAVNWVPDGDRVIRAVPLLFALNKQIVPSLAAEVLRLAQDDGASYVIKSSNASGETAFGAQTGIVAVRIGNLDPIETQPQGDIRIRFTPHDERRYIPAWKLLAGQVDPAEIANKMIFVGSSALGLGDFVTTPLDASVPGVEMHAQLVERILNKDYLLRPDIAGGIELLAMVALSLIMIFTLPFVSSIVAALIGGACVAGMIGGSWWAFIAKSTLIDPVYPSLSAGAVFLVGMVTLYGLKQSQERFVREAFGRYVSPEVVHQLAENPEKLILGGVDRELTVLFCDLRSFTTLSETFDAHGLTRFLNEYLSPLTDVAIANLGTIDKYIGDAIMAFWNAPLDDPNHARNAAATALAMRGELAKLNERWQARAAAENKSFPIVRFGVGLNTGTCCVGNLGSTLKFNYSCIGDDVNIASRLEGATKFFGVDIAANQTTRDEAPELAWLEIDQVLVKGKTVPIGVHALVGDAALAQGEGFAKLASAHNAMLAAYRGREFQKAITFADTARTEAPAEIKGLYAFHGARFEHYLAEPPAEDWKPVLKLDEK